MTRAEPLATSHGAMPSIADVDANGYLDVIVGSVFGLAGMRATDSNVFFRTAGGFGEVRGYPTVAAVGTAALDWTGDGRIDLLFSSHRTDLGEYRLAARLYRSRPLEPPSSASFDSFPALGGWGGMANDLGNTYDRRFVERFESRVFDLLGAPREVFLEWTVNLPTGTTLRMQVRTAETREQLDDALWYGPSGSDSFFGASPARIPGAQRLVQYRASFEAPNAVSSPVLDRVALRWR